MLRKEFIQMRRHRLTLAMMIGIPSIQLALFGFAIRTEVRHLPTLVLDDARSRESRELVATLINSTYFDVVEEVRSREQVADRIGRGRAAAAVIIPATFTRDLKRRRGAEAQVIVDAADPLASQAAIQGAALVGLRFRPAASGTAATAPVVARLQKIISGLSNMRGIDEYLTLLSVAQTCEYQGIDFLDFLCSGEKDIHVFAESKQKRRRDRVSLPIRSMEDPAYHHQNLCGIDMPKK